MEWKEVRELVHAPELRPSMPPMGTPLPATPWSARRLLLGEKTPCRFSLYIFVQRSVQDSEKGQWLHRAHFNFIFFVCGEIDQLSIT